MPAHFRSVVCEAPSRPKPVSSLKMVWSVAPRWAVLALLPAIVGGQDMRENAVRCGAAPINLGWRVCADRTGARGSSTADGCEALRESDAPRDLETLVRVNESTLVFVERTLVLK